MTADHFETTLDVLLGHHPFQAFTVELVTGQRIEIDHKRAVTSRGGYAVFLSPGGVPIFFDHEGVVQIVYAPAHSAP